MNDPWAKLGGTPQEIFNPVDSDTVYPSGWDAMMQDELLALWDGKKAALAQLKSDEMELRKYIVKRAFPAPTEGTNKVELGAGYELKAVVKFNYKLIGTNDQIEEALDRIALIGNEGSFIASKLVTWSADLHKKEYTDLQEAAKAGSKFAAQVVDEINKVLQIDDAAPTLDIEAPKGKK